MMVAFFTALVTLLANDATLQTLISSGRTEQGLPAVSAPLPVYPGKAPPNEPTPFLVYNSVGEPAFDTSDSLGVEPTFDVHVYASSQLLARQILERVTALLSDASLSLSGPSLVFCRRTNSRCDPEGEDFHGVATFRAIISN